MSVWRIKYKIFNNFVYLCVVLCVILCTVQKLSKFKCLLYKILCSFLLSISGNEFFLLFSENSKYVFTDAMLICFSCSATRLSAREDYSNFCWSCSLTNICEWLILKLSIFLYSTLSGRALGALFQRFQFQFLDWILCIILVLRLVVSVMNHV